MRFEPNEVKLHVGCADKKLDGFINIDTRETSATDIVADAWKIEGIEKGEVALIYSRHMVEHLDPNDARATLRHWHDLLMDSGILHVIVPDIVFHAKQLLGLDQSTFPDQMMHAFAGFWGWRDEHRGGARQDAHRWGYTYETLQQELKDAGFDFVIRAVEGEDTEKWHLNVVAAKSKAAILSRTEA